MRKLDLNDYTVKMKVPDKMNPGKEIEAELPYHVKDSILNVMFIPDLKLSSAELVKQNVLAMKIEASNGYAMIEDEEYQRIKTAFDTFKGFSRQDVELVERINNAEIVEVESTK